MLIQNKPLGRLRVQEVPSKAWPPQFQKIGPCGSNCRSHFLDCTNHFREAKSKTSKSIIYSYSIQIIHILLSWNPLENEIGDPQKQCVILIIVNSVSSYKSHGFKKTTLKQSCLLRNMCHSTLKTKTIQQPWY
jgi:hypothetical protein